jgi:hypothetical protein
MLRCVSTEDHRNMVRSQPMPLSATVAIDRRSLLLRAGDVERNPGPIFLIFLAGACVVGGVGATTAITQTASEEKDALCDTECADEDAAVATAVNVQERSAAAAAPSVLDIDEASQEVTAARDGGTREDAAAVGVQAEAARSSAEADDAVMSFSLRSAAESSQPASPIAIVSVYSSERNGGHSANSCGTPLVPRTPVQPLTARRPSQAATITRDRAPLTSRDQTKPPTSSQAPRKQSTVEPAASAAPAPSVDLSNLTPYEQKEIREYSTLLSISSVEQDAPEMRVTTVEPPSQQSANPSFAEPHSPPSAKPSFAEA